MLQDTRSNAVFISDDISHSLTNLCYFELLYDILAVMLTFTRLYVHCTSMYFMYLNHSKCILYICRLILLVVIVWMALKRERNVHRRVHLASATKQYAATSICQGLQIAFTFCATEWIAWLSHNQGFILLMSSSSPFPWAIRRACWLKAFIVDDR